MKDDLLKESLIVSCPDVRNKAGGCHHIVRSKTMDTLRAASVTQLRQDVLHLLEPSVDVVVAEELARSFVRPICLWRFCKRYVCADCDSRIPLQLSRLVCVACRGAWGCYEPQQWSQCTFSVPVHSVRTLA